MASSKKPPTLSTRSRRRSPEAEEALEAQALTKAPEPVVEPDPKPTKKRTPKTKRHPVGTERFSLNLPASEAAGLTDQARSEGVPTTWILRALVSKYLEDESLRASVNESAIRHRYRSPAPD